MGWRLWPDICKEYYSVMYWVLDLIMFCDVDRRDLVLRKFFVELEKSDLPKFAKENFLFMFSHNLSIQRNIFNANRSIILESEKAEQWEKEQEKGFEEISKILTATGEREEIEGEIPEEEKKYVGISMLPNMLDNQEYSFTIDGVEVKGTKRQFIERFKKSLLSDKVKKDNDLEEMPKSAEGQTFDVLAVPCDRAFVVSPEKVEEFKDAKPDSDKTSKASEYAEQLIENIENGTLQRKTYLNHGEKHSRDLEELMQYKSQKYLGSLRCWIDTKTMKSIYTSEEDKSIEKTLKKK